ncbi:hypothetical protein WH47_08745 [Habropoda laboriosa]|uniref:Uncharacterized protein n=1 Tax=Habropoda laboriosa TaxID=597456 RepID=A0A0L7QP09_9HYME|nr:hypothetical protein WH47_08745 [Habropoda laboriosa]
MIRHLDNVYLGDDDVQPFSTTLEMVKCCDHFGPGVQNVQIGGGIEVNTRTEQLSYSTQCDQQRSTRTSSCGGSRLGLELQGLVGMFNVKGRLVSNYGLRRTESKPITVNSKLLGTQQPVRAITVLAPDICVRCPKLISSHHVECRWSEMALSRIRSSVVRFVRTTDMLETNVEDLSECKDKTPIYNQKQKTPRGNTSRYFSKRTSHNPSIWYQEAKTGQSPPLR